MTKGHANAVRRSHRLVELLAGRFFDGAANKALAADVGTSPTNITRDLQTLADIGYARRLENGLWALTPKPLAVMQTFSNHYQTMQTRLAEAGQNILAASWRG
jgi:DNA-binding IclR family transcriptional regulator